MGGAGWLFLFAVLMAAGLLFCMVFFIIMFSDLECDYINPIDLCNKLNQFVLPENIAHALFDPAFPALWTMDRVPLELAVGSFQCKQDTKQKPHVLMLRRYSGLSQDTKKRASSSLGSTCYRSSTTSTGSSVRSC
ncbi:cornichon protein-domain-containing protein, partial [Armillaria novae-zelandiae]